MAILIFKVDNCSLLLILKIVFMYILLYFLFPWDDVCLFVLLYANWINYFDIPRHWIEKEILAKFLSSTFNNNIKVFGLYDMLIRPPENIIWFLSIFCEFDNVFSYSTLLLIYHIVYVNSFKYEYFWIYI